MYLFVCLLVPFNVLADMSLSVADGAEHLEEGRTYEFTFEYTQTEGTDFYNYKKNHPVDVLAYNSFVSFNSSFPVGKHASISYRNDGFMVYLCRNKTTELEVKIADASITVPTFATKNLFNVKVDVKNSMVRVWLDTDTTDSPVMSHKVDCNREGKIIVVGAVNDDMFLHTDYAYGLRFAFHVPKGTKIGDVEKTNNQLVLYNYSHVTMPPILAQSMPNSDGTIIYCQPAPTPMTDPIPAGTFYKFRWKEKINQCKSTLENKVEVELYNHAAQSVVETLSLPCGDRTCLLDTVLVENLGVCDGENTVVAANIGVPKDDYVFAWTGPNGIVTNEGDSIFTTSADGNYVLSVYGKDDETCVVTTEKFSLKKGNAVAVNLADTIRSKRGEVSLQPVEDDCPKCKYAWSNGSDAPTISVTQSGEYSVVVTNGDCKSEASTYVEISKPVDLVIPTVLTPNGDGVNDVFEVPMLTESYPNSRIAIYNREGVKLAEFLAEAPGWDGTYNGNDMPSTDYWYEIYIPLLYKYYVGHFTLLRSKK